MKVLQLRHLLTTAAEQHERLGKGELATSLRLIASALKAADKIQVEALAKRLQR